jgi:hypothetical protein
VLRGETVYDGKVIDTKGRYYIPKGLTTEPMHSREGPELLVHTLPMYVRAIWQKVWERPSRGRLSTPDKRGRAQRLPWGRV